MMKVLSLDVSTKTGWAVFNNKKLIDTGVIVNPKSVLEYGQYPYCYIYSTRSVIKQIASLVDIHEPDTIVVEETNKGKNRYTQKVLEFLHCSLLLELENTPYSDKIKYVNTSDWRKTLNVYLTKDDKKNNSKVYKAKKQGKTKKEVGVKGKINKKHVSVRVANTLFNLTLKQKDNDIADAILLGAAYIEGVSICDGK